MRMYYFFLSVSLSVFLSVFLSDGGKTVTQQSRKTLSYASQIAWSLHTRKIRAADRLELLCHRLKKQVVC